MRADPSALPIASAAASFSPRLRPAICLVPTRIAGHEQGAASIIVGIAAVESIRRNKPVTLTDLVPLKPSAKKLSELE